MKRFESPAGNILVVVRDGPGDDVGLFLQFVIEKLAAMRPQEVRRP